MHAHEGPSSPFVAMMCKVLLVLSNQVVFAAGKYFTVTVVSAWHCGLCTRRCHMAHFHPETVYITPPMASLYFSGIKGDRSPGSILYLLPPFPVVRHVLAMNFREHMCANYKTAVPIPDWAQQKSNQ